MTVVPPIAGPGTETLLPALGLAWCGECGYTGRAAGPRQARCHRWSWHAALRRAVNAELPPAALDPAERHR